MVIENVNIFKSHSFERLVKACREIFSRAVSVTVWTCPHFIACLGGNAHLVTELSHATVEYPAEVFLCRAVVGIAIVVCKVKMCDTAVERSVYHSFHVLKIVFQAEILPKAQRQRRKLKPAFPTAVVYHFVISSIVRYKHFKKPPI